MSNCADDLPENPSPRPEPSNAVSAWGRVPSPVQGERSSADASGQGDSAFALAAPNPANTQPAELVPAAADPAWSGWDVLRLAFVAVVALFAGVFGVLLIFHWWLYPHARLGEIARFPLVAVGGQSLAYLLIVAYMYVLVTRERRRPDFLAAIHWNWPANIGAYVLLGIALSLGLQGLAHLLPIPKELPIDNFFRTPTEVWAIGILSVTLAPLLEELFFRAFLYPVLARRLGLPIAVVLTAVGFALLHVAQLGFTWGPVLIIFVVGIVLTTVRAKKNSVAAGVVIHMAYNGTIFAIMFYATDGFRHLEKLRSQ